MRYAVIADLHSNIEAFDAVLKSIKEKKIKDIVFLGDAVGYGPNPNECIKTLKAHCKKAVAGNHDWGAAGLTDISYFNEYAIAAILWTKETLTEESSEYLKSLPMVENIKERDMFIVHSTPKEPDKWHYIYSLWDAEINFNFFDERIALTGHSHRPAVIERMPSGEIVIHRDMVDLNESSRYIINAGSVGQPRDMDPRSCYAILTENHVEFVRVEYNIGLTQRKMADAGLPHPLIERLGRGT